MKTFYLFIVFFFIVDLTVLKSEPTSIFIVSTVVASFGFIYQLFYCMFDECCYQKSNWIPLNIKKLREELSMNLYGQHLVQLDLLNHLQNHVINEKPMKALLLSFNGMIGTGKNYVSTMIANSLYKNGMKSKYVHLFVSNIHFPFKEKVTEYKNSLQNYIKEAVKKCERNLFIFDEVENMPGSLLDAIKPFVDFHESIDGVDYRKSIFLLLSNSGGININKKVIQVYEEGRVRESITLNEMEEILAKNLYNMKNDGLRESKLIEHCLITAFIPFLPLEKKHVQQCVVTQLKRSHIHEDDDVVKQVIDLLNFENIGGLYLAVQGCKRIEEKLQLVIKNQ